MDVKKVDVQKSTWDIILNGYDDHVNDWFLMSSPLTPILIISAYLLFVLKIGPAYMKDKPAYSLRNVLIVHNATQVLYSSYLVYTGFNIFYNSGFIEKTCAMENKEHAYLVRRGIHLYLIGKFSELLDTIFFVLRKKWKQISFLHVYHHSIMFSMCWFFLKYSPSHSFIFLGELNSFVHIIMYAYYGLAAFPSLSKYLWWKKYITKMQLIQFVIVGIICTVNFYASVCPTTYFLISITWLHVALFFYLFSKFYIESYIKNKKIKENFAKENATAKNITKYEQVNDHKVTEKIR